MTPRPRSNHLVFSKMLIVRRDGVVVSRTPADTKASTEKLLELRRIERKAKADGREFPYQWEII